MNSTQSVADAIVAWARGNLAAIQTGYAFAADQKTGDLPDVAAEIQQIRLQRTSPENFPEANIEQVLVRIYEFNLMFLVAPEPADEATEQLEEFVDTITEAIIADPSMNEVLPNTAITPVFDTTFTPPFVEFEDGTRGRMAIMELKVGEIVDSFGSQL